MKVKQVIRYGLEAVLFAVLAWFLASTALLAFWANKIVFNDAIAIAVIGLAATVSFGVVYALDRWVVRRYLL